MDDDASREEEPGTPLASPPSEEGEDPAPAPGPKRSSSSKAPGSRDEEQEKPTPEAAPAGDPAPEADEPISQAVDDWIAPRRIALIVAFAISLALYFGTAAALLRIPGILPIPGGLALAAGLLELPSLLLFVVGFERRAMTTAPLLLLSGAGGISAYFVGGAVSVGSPTTLGAGVIAIVLFLFLGHRARESRKRRIRRVRRWSRNGVVIGVLLLLLAAALYTSYGNAPSVHPISAVTLTEGVTLTPGTNTSFTVTGSPGDELYLLFGASNASANVQGEFLTQAGGPSLAGLGAGSLSSPSFLPLSLQSGGGAFLVLITFPQAPQAPSQVTVKWTTGDISSNLVAMGATSVLAGWTGFVLFVAGVTIWVTSRPPPEPEEKKEGGKAEGEEGGVEGKETSPPEEGRPLESSKEPAPTSLDGGTSSTDRAPGTPLASAPKASDKGKTKPADEDQSTSSATSK